jgi:hypothetical protein
VATISGREARLLEKRPPGRARNRFTVHARDDQLAEAPVVDEFMEGGKGGAPGRRVIRRCQRLKGVAAALEVDRRSSIHENHVCARGPLEGPSVRGTAARPGQGRSVWICRVRGGK